MVLHFIISVEVVGNPAIVCLSWILHLNLLWHTTFCTGARWGKMTKKISLLTIDGTKSNLNILINGYAIFYFTISSEYQHLQALVSQNSFELNWSNNKNNNNNLLHLYSAFLDTQRLYIVRWISPHDAAPVCSIHLDDATAAILRQNAHQTPAYWWRGDRDEANQFMEMIRRPWWSEANQEIWPGCWGYTSTLFRRTSWDF